MALKSVEDTLLLDFTASTAVEDAADVTVVTEVDTKQIDLTAKVFGSNVSSSLTASLSINSTFAGNYIVLPKISGTVPELTDTSVVHAPTIINTVSNSSSSTSTLNYLFQGNLNIDSSYTLTTTAEGFELNSYINNTVTNYPIKTSLLSELCLVFRDAKCPNAGMQVLFPFEVVPFGTINYNTVSVRVGGLTYPLDVTYFGVNTFDVTKIILGQTIDKDVELFDIVYPDLVVESITVQNLQYFEVALNTFDIDSDSNRYKLDFTTFNLKSFDIQSRQMVLNDSILMQKFNIPIDFAHTGIDKTLINKVKCNTSYSYDPVLYCFTIEDNLYKVHGKLQDNNAFTEEAKKDLYRVTDYENNPYYIADEPIRIGALVEGTLMTYNTLNNRYTKDGI